MAGVGRRIAYRKKNQNRLSMFLVTLVVLMIMLVVAVKSVELQQKLDIKAQELQLLQEQIDAENARAEQIREFGKEVQTKVYIEDVAREKLGLVYEGEILFKEQK